MPRHSRGCRACRKRRIGCDGQHPICRNCQLWNRECSGPVRTVIIIDQTSAVTEKHARGPRPTAQSSSPLSFRVSNSAMEGVALKSQFFSFAVPEAKAAVKSFLGELQQSQLDDNALSLEPAICAVALAFCSTVTLSKAAGQQARELYVLSLRRQNSAIARCSSPPNVATICTSVMLSYFEAIQPTAARSTGYGMHLNGAWRMLAATENLHAQPLLWQATKHILCQQLLTMILSPSIYMSTTSDTWPPFEIFRSKYSASDAVFDRLAIELYVLTDVFVKRGFGHKAASSPRDTYSKLDSLWTEFQKVQDGPETLGAAPTEQRVLYEGVVKLTLSYFAASWILIALLEPQTKQLLPAAKLWQACETILDCAKLLKAKATGCVHMRAFYPLALVQTCSPSEQHRTRAQSYVQMWLQKAAFVGLGLSVSPRMQTGT